MKISAIALPSPFAKEPAMNPPLGLCYISSTLKMYGNHEIKGVDLSFYEEYYINYIPDDSDLYLIYCMTPQFKYLKEVVDKIRNINQNAEVFAGGPHPTALSKETYEITGVDSVVIGEGEQQINEYINKTRNASYTINALPFPDRELFGLDNYKRHIGSDKAVHIVTLRGCPYTCAFCDKDSVGRMVRYRTVDNVMAEVEQIISTYGIKALVIYDDIFTLKKNRVEQFCNEFKKLGIKWRCWSRADTIDKELLTLMKLSGLTSITIGIESGSDTILKNINKGTTAQDNYNALNACKESGVPVRCSLMYGNPGETKKTLTETIKMIESTKPDEWNLAILVPIPGSDIWKYPLSFGIEFYKDHMRKNLYDGTDRFCDSGIGNITVSLDSMSDIELRRNLKWFVSELERVSPRRKIQDTVQDIKV